ncbi:proteasome subunit beta [Candidatus Marsarchaeota G2 archaeon ECH_B_SAG-F08]|jgi:proteasome beta subunit|uniref:Proteasome subunit beta n=8 Tax=Candidatus Marsarchaeota TaxID=1978152 RepID=A0A2R6C3K2_9ARCH|nr:MAG: proteasome subunit beta [Candidatus Marsarchaeota G1 archaeon OSP_D]PSN86857.1 MAG: proteasome subunit beta [Candidatus Marsarchaeota G1 archaeon BE_D]PSN87385.1 MAG: proteasome subunit beta [Candidatus Marsarchaeota G1 archaeon OSP_B]PSN89113.1 MAG: proteasome subunit beta [Candidatus Marsarchaeota G1 archaeon OSP_C]PSN97105.1 MAG: proteasome subunit beta [Candidatus Marsarchaeota G2 archaeon ECH_B_SAG-F08]PSO03259.1 MAG: proteasome subunit beta [Candidatus Marsarchaeota G2 archaeon E
MSFEVLVGGTTVGIKTVEGVVLAADKRLVYGYTILSKSAKKVYPINDRIGVGFAGLIGDMQALVRRVVSMVNLYEIENETKISVASVGKLLSVILYNSRFTPYLTETILGGYDNNGFHLYTLDALGSLLLEDYTAIGTGAGISLGILESEYKEQMSLDEAIGLAIKSVKQAIMRDIGSGDGIDLLIITNQGTREQTFALESK